MERFTTEEVFYLIFKDQIENNKNISNLPFDLIKYETFLGNKIIELFNLKIDQKLLYFYETGFEDYKDYLYLIYPDEFDNFINSYDFSHYCKNYPVLLYYFFNNNKYPFNNINIESDVISVENNYKLYEHIFKYQINNKTNINNIEKLKHLHYDDISSLSGEKIYNLLKDEYKQYILNFRVMNKQTRASLSNKENTFLFVYPDELSILYNNFTFSRMFFEKPIMNPKTEEFKRNEKCLRFC